MATGYGSLGRKAAKTASGAVISGFNWGSVGENLTSAAVAGTALAGISGASNAIGKSMDKSKFADVISYAKQKHPELRNVQDKQLNEWMKAFYALSPNIATNRELGASMLQMAKNYGGNIDMATAKMIAEAGAKSGGSNHGETVLNFMSGGRSYGNSSGK